MRLLRRNSLIEAFIAAAFIYAWLFGATFTGKLYGLLFTALWNKEIDFDTDTIAVILTTSSHTPDQDAHNYVDDITNEVSGGGYARVNLGSKTVGYTGGTNKHKLDAADSDFATATFTFRNVHLADVSPGADSSRPLLGYQAADGDVTGAGGTLTLVWHASGIIEITVG